MVARGTHGPWKLKERTKQMKIMVVSGSRHSSARSSSSMLRSKKRSYSMTGLPVKSTSVSLGTWSWYRARVALLSSGSSAISQTVAGMSLPMGLRIAAVSSHKFVHGVPPKLVASLVIMVSIAWLVGTCRYLHLWTNPYFFNGVQLGGSNHRPLTSRKSSCRNSMSCFRYSQGAHTVRLEPLEPSKVA